MKLILFFLISIMPGASFAQIVNGSFENGPLADLSSWNWTCSSQSSNSAPVGGGNWCIQVDAGNFQGYFPGYAYQQIPSATNGQAYILCGWAFAETASSVGVYFGKIKNGNITTQSGSTTASNSWVQLSIQSGFTLSPGDTAVVVLYGGLVSGASQGYGYFDLIDLTPVTGVSDTEQKATIKIFPTQFNDQLTIEVKNDQAADIVLYDITSRKLLQLHFTNSISLNTSAFTKGIYLYEVKNEKGVVKNGKLIKE